MTSEERPRRSALYMPANNARAVEKARGLACDVVILDLEDAVAPEAKPAARAAAVAAIRAGGFGARELAVRVNAIDSAWGPDDLAALGQVSPAAVVLPKVGEGAAVAAYSGRLPDVPLWAMIETPPAILRLDGIAAAPGITALVAGTNDLAKELHATPGVNRVPLHGALSSIVTAARAYGLVALDGVSNALDDPAAFAAECAQGAAFGFDGKTLIHPSQIAAANAAFGPDAEAVAWAERVVAAFAEPAAAGRGAIRLDGQMVERLHLSEAERTLALAAAVAG